MSKKPKGIMDIPGVTVRKNKNGTDTYSVTVYMGRDARGKQQRRYATYTPAPGESKRETVRALEALRQELLTARVNEHSKESAQTLAQFSAFFIADCNAAGCTAKTLSNYRQCLKRINAELGNVPLNKLTTTMIDTFYRKLESTTKAPSAVALPALMKAVKTRKLTQTALAEQAGVSTSTLRNALYGKRVSVDTAERITAALGRKLDKLFIISQGETLGAETVLSHHRVLHAVLKVAKKKKLVAYNEADDTTRPRRPDKEAMTLQPEQIQTLLKAVEDEPLVWLAIIHCYLVTGARRGEMCGLLWSQVDLEKGTIAIIRARQYTSEEGTYDGDTKNRQHRYICLPPQTMELLRDWKREQARMALAAGDAWERTGYVFTWYTGQPLHPDSISKHIHAIAEKTGLDGMHTHTLRHTAASVLLGANIDEATVANHLGHRDANTTRQIYAHAIERNKAKSAEALGGVIYGQKVAGEK